MVDKLMNIVQYIHNDDTQNYSFYKLQLVVHTQLMKIQLKSPKLFRQRIRKRYYKTLVTSEINSPCPLPSRVRLHKGGGGRNDISS